MEAIEYTTPNTIDEAVQAMAAAGDRARALAGGTDLLVQLRGGRRSADLVVDVKNIPELNEVSYDPQNGLTIGAAAACYQIYANEDVAANYAGLVDSASLIGSIQIQGRASLGGNLCNSAPSADAIPPMIALGGVANIAGPNGTRQVAVEDFCTGPGRNVLEPRRNPGIHQYSGASPQFRRQLPAIYPPQRNGHRRGRRGQRRGAGRLGPELRFRPHCPGFRGPHSRILPGGPAKVWLARPYPTKP